MGTFIDLTGQKFGRYTVLEQAPSRVSKDKDRVNGKKRTMWRCQCDCGTIKDVDSWSLRSGHIVSCGCYLKDNMRKRMTKHGATLFGKPTHLYKVWDGMKARCYNPEKVYYDRYGGRGITMCDEWRYSFEAFQEWAYANGYQENLTIDRINNDRGYFPDNCRWATDKEQSNNKSDNHYLTFNGETKTLMQWSEITGFPYYTLSSRANKWKDATAEEILLTPRKVDKNGHRTYVQSKLLERND